ncbi:MAG: ketopantoate reductase family protein [FCB group bacterium]|nr:ketopantoate reductase family protein [FCB group bacterium]
MQKQKIAVIGAGPVGSVLAVHLTNAGHEVYLVDVISGLIDVIRENGLQIVGAEENYARIENTCTSIDQLEGVEPHQIYICIKAIDLPGVSLQLENLKLDNTLYISFQNGIDNEEVLAKHFPRARVFRGVINYAGMTVRPGTVKMTFFHPPNFIGSLDPKSRDIAKAIARQHSQAGIETQYSEIIKRDAWRKSILNSVLMPVSVTTRLSMGKIMQDPGLKTLVGTLLKDFLEVARQENYHYEADFYEKAIGYLSNAGDHKPSMLMDFESGRPLEIDFLNNRLQAYADKHGLPCKANKLLCSLVKGMLFHRDVVTSSS